MALFNRWFNKPVHSTVEGLTTNGDTLSLPPFVLSLSKDPASVAISFEMTANQRSIHVAPWPSIKTLRLS